MTENSECILEKIIQLGKDNRCDLIEAATIYCEENEIDVQDLYESLDKTSIDRLRQDAIDNRRVRQVVEQPRNALQFE